METNQTPQTTSKTMDIIDISTQDLQCKKDFRDTSNEDTKEQDEAQGDDMNEIDFTTTTQKHQLSQFMDSDTRLMVLDEKVDNLINKQWELYKKNISLAKEIG